MPGNGDCRHDRAGSGDGFDPDPGCDGFPDQVAAGIGDGRRACVRYESDILTAHQPRDDRRSLLRFVVLVKARGRRRDRMPSQQMSRLARVFSGDDRHFAQHSQRPQR